MRILFISEYYPSTKALDIHGGVEARTYQTASFLAGKHQVFIIAAAEKGKPKQQILNGVNIFRIGFARSYSRKNKLSRIIFIISSFYKGLFIKFDLIEGTGFWGFISAFLLGFIKKSKKVIFVPDTIENYAVNIDFLSKFILKITEKFILTRCWDKIICISSEVKRKVINLGCNKNLVSVIYCGTNILSNFSNKPDRIKNNSITCVSRLVPYKNIPDLIRAVSLAKRSIPDIKLNIVGEGEEYGNLKRLAKKLNLAQNIKFYGFIPKHINVLRIIKNTAVFCLPSGTEGFGIATVEAMALGVPVILPNIPIHREITGCKGVMFYQLNNHSNLAKKIILLLKDNKLYSKLQRAALNSAKKYDWSKITLQTQQLYESLYAD